MITGHRFLCVKLDSAGVITGRDEVGRHLTPLHPRSSAFSLSATKSPPQLFDAHSERIICADVRWVLTRVGTPANGSLGTGWI